MGSENNLNKYIAALHEPSTATHHDIAGALPD
jgi:hypothetical protein